MRLKMQVILQTVFLGIVLTSAAAFCAEAASPEQSLAFPKWLQMVLGIVGIAGSATVAAGAQKITKLLTLIADLRSVVDNLVHFFFALKGKIKDPELMLDMNQSIDAMAKILEDTGNQSLSRKAASLRQCKTKIEAWIGTTDVPAQVAPTVSAQNQPQPQAA
jgi:hypothetical protein